MAKYSMHRALAELKLLDKRINKTINNLKVVTCKKGDKLEYNIAIAEEEFKAVVEADMQSVKDLITRRKEIKEKIVKSNAETLVTIAGKEMTVAAAIERKESIKYEKKLAEELKNQLNNLKAIINNRNEQVEYSLERQLGNLTSNPDADKELVLTFSEQYRNKEQFALVDPLNIEKVIEELENEIDSFESEVDYVLSTSNAITEIEV